MYYRKRLYSYPGGRNVTDGPFRASFGTGSPAGAGFFRKQR
jgi:hypothetical protein